MKMGEDTISYVSKLSRINFTNDDEINQDGSHTRHQLGG